MENGEAPDAIEVKKLSGKEKKFAQLYLGKCNMNGAAAARAAGYSPKTAKEIAYELLRKPHIRNYIDERLNLEVTTPSEVLSILSEQVKGKVTDLLDENGGFDLAAAKERGTDRLIKKLRITEKVNAEGEVTERKVDFEIHDPQVAADKIGRFHKLFTEKHEVGGVISTYAMSKEEWERDALDKLNRTASQLSKFHDTTEDDNSDDTDPESDAADPVSGSVLSDRD